MKNRSSNPPGNRLPPNVDMGGLRSALLASGYPLQGLVAESLLEDYGVVEEWGFIDTDTDKHRALDLYAWRDPECDEDATICPGVSLLVECKRSIHPYVFFQSVSPNEAQRFPSIAGLRDEFVELRAGRSRGVRHLSQVLGLDEFDFIAKGPPRCAAFTKGVAKGDKVDLSGSDPYNSTILPLVKAHDHLISLYTDERSQPTRIHPRIVVLVAVIDAPMLLVDDPHRPDDFEMVPWVRVVRREATREKWNRTGWQRFITIDAVHAEFLGEYLNDHLGPFLDSATSRIRESEEIIRRGGSVEDLRFWSWRDVKAVEKGSA